jgi:hypothetical protein
MQRGFDGSSGMDKGRPIGKAALGLCLAVAAFAGPAAAAAAPGDVPAGYRIISVTDFGKAIATRKPGGQSVQKTVQATVRDLTKAFGAPPVVSNPYEDVEDHRSGGASFDVEVRGWPVRGAIFCKLVPKGTEVTVVFGRPDTPPEEWSRLSNAASAPPTLAPAASAPPPPARANAAAPVESAAPFHVSVAHAHLRPYHFPDDTGTVGIADGWRCNNPSAMGGFLIEGPANQRITSGTMYTISTPSSPLRFPGSLVAPFTTPAEAFKILVPQWSQKSARAGGPSFEVDDVVPRATSKSLNPSGRAAQITYGVTEMRNGSRAHYRALALVDFGPIPNGNRAPITLTMMVTALRAPDATFKRDLPLMLQMTNSFRENAQVITRKSNQQLAAQKQRFATQQAQMRDKQQTFENNLHDQARASNARSRSNDDFDEYIRGTRTVEDTRTGEKASVDLGYVDQTTDTLNQNDPGRYRQIPLRDEADPVPAQ